MNTIVRFALGAAAFAMPVQTLAAAPEQCMTKVEAKSLFVFILPSAVEGLAAKCRSALPADAYLLSPGAAARFRSESEASWPGARAAFGRIAGPAAMKVLDDSTTRKLISTSIVDGIASDVKPKSCVGIDQLLSALQPLPPANFSALIESFMTLGLGTDGRSGSFRLCPEPGEPKPVFSGVAKTGE